MQQNANASDIERKNSKPSANLIILGSIYEKTDENGNVINALSAKYLRYMIFSPHI